jgi:hypothetical protein
VAAGPTEPARPPDILAHVKAPGRRTRRILIVVVALLVINVPYVVYRYQFHRVSTDGIQVTATVVSSAEAGNDVLLELRFPTSVDPDQKSRRARVDATAGQQAVQSGEVDVRVLEGHPDVFTLEGQHRGHGAAILTFGSDAVILLLILLSWRLGGRIRRPALVAVALGDVESGEEGSLLDKQDDGTYVINGEVTGSGPDSVVITLRDRDVTVHLRGHANPVDVGGRARVLGHLVG